MRKIVYWITLVCLVVPIASGFAVAENNEEQLSVMLSAEKILRSRDAQGNEVIRLVEPEKLLPGEEIIYTLTYRNRHSAPADDIAIANPIDPNLLYKIGSAKGLDTLVVFSIDGGATFDEPQRLEVTTADGRTRPALPQDYTHVRWVRTRALDLEETATVSFAAVVR